MKWRSISPWLFSGFLLTPPTMEDSCLDCPVLCLPFKALPNPVGFGNGDFRKEVERRMVRGWGLRRLTELLVFGEQHYEPLRSLWLGVGTVQGRRNWEDSNMFSFHAIWEIQGKYLRNFEITFICRDFFFNFCFVVIIWLQNHSWAGPPVS